MKNFKAASAATAALCLMHGAAQAQDTAAASTAPAGSASTSAANSPSQGVAEVIVTAQHRSENLQKVPISITAVSGDVLARNNLTSLQDLSAIAPSLVVSKSISYGLAPISIRGLGGPAGGGSLFTDQPVAVYVDGVYVPALGQSVSDFLDVDGVQVLRGPQGTLYGRNSTAGAVLITSKRPSFDFGGEARASYGSFDASSLSAAVNIPLVKDVLALRIAAGHNGGGDWADNTVDGRKFGGERSTTERVSLRYSPNNILTIDLIGDHSEGYSKPATVPLSTATLTYAGPTLGTVYVADPFQRRADFDTALNDRKVQIVADQFTRTKSTDGTILAQLNLGTLKLNSITGVRDFTVTGAQDATPYTVPAAVTNTNTSDQHQKSYSEELRLSYDHGPLRWTTGLFYFHQDTNASIDIIALQGGPPVATSIGPFGPVFAGKPTGTSALFLASQSVDSYAAFVDATYDLTDKLSVTGGLRYSDDQKDATIDNVVTTLTNTALAAPVLSAASCPSPTESCKANYDNISPRAVLNYKLTPNNLLYASFSKGFNSGGFNNFGNVAVPTDPTNPLQDSSEKITSYEIGAKNEFFDRRWRLNLSAFVTDYDDLHIRQAVFTGGVSIVNVPKAQVKGVELESVFAPIQGLTFTLNGSYLDGELQKGTLTELSSAVGPIVVGQNITVGSENIAGNALTRAPKFQGYAAANYRYPTPYGEINATADIHGQTKTYFLETNQDVGQYVAAGWQEVDLRLALAGDGGRWEAAVYCKNVGDERYISQIVPFSGFPIATLNTPRSVGVSLSGKF